MQKRMEEIGGSIIVQSPPEGTEITLVLNKYVNEKNK